MIISASRRTDIPAFYADWFMNRIQNGFVRVKNPFNPAQIRDVSLRPEDVEAIVFWTKNPANLLPHLHSLNEYHYYFLFSLTAYGMEMEKNVPAEDALIKTFLQLSDKIGPEKVIWRYDPILLTETMNDDFHIQRFERIAKTLRSYTKTCIISFLEVYEKCKRNMKSFPVILPDDAQKKTLMTAMSQIAGSYDISLRTCAESTNFSDIGIQPARCVDPDLISSITGKPVSMAKDPNQRKTCQCVKSVDIGAYNTCPHGCVFCYANANPEIAEKYLKNFKPEAISFL